MLTGYRMARRSTNSQILNFIMGTCLNAAAWKMVSGLNSDSRGADSLTINYIGNTKGNLGTGRVPLKSQTQIEQSRFALIQADKTSGSYSRTGRHNSEPIEPAAPSQLQFVLPSFFGLTPGQSEQVNLKGSRANRSYSVAKIAGVSAMWLRAQRRLWREKTMSQTLPLHRF